MSRHPAIFYLFVLLTGVLFVRPTELVESLADAPIYEALILSCLSLAAYGVAVLVSPRELARDPVTACVVGLLPAVALSHASHFALGQAAGSAFEFLKILLSYLLLVAVLNTPARLRAFLAWLVVFILALTMLALLQHYEVIDNPALAAHREHEFDEHGAVLGEHARLSGAGIFGNPNDLSRILVIGIVLCWYFFDGGARSRFKPLCLVAIGIFGHALILTMSRGGLIALGVSLLVLAAGRIGVARALVLAALGLPVVGAVIGGRQADVSTSEGTGQQRVQLWSDGLEALNAYPLFGTGMGTYEEFAGGLGAHNSFVHAYTELGFFGGTLFAGAFIAAVWLCREIARNDRGPGAVPGRRLRFALLAVLLGYSAGLLSSSRCYVIPTYFFLGLVVAYVRTATAGRLLPSCRVTSGRVGQLVLVGALVLATLKISVFVLIR